MKLFLNSFFICLFFVSTNALGENYFKEYLVKVSGIKIGKLEWSVKINKTNYINEINLKSEGLLSGLYKFEGKYYSEGVVDNNRLKPVKYNHFWKTKKITKQMELAFKNNKLISLNQEPLEKEVLRINVFDIKENKDPLTSFLEIILGQKRVSVVDGRRVYTLSAALGNTENQTVVGVLDYFNLWADHKRSKFEKIIFEKNDIDTLPNNIHIYFDGRRFSLKKI